MIQYLIAALDDGRLNATQVGAAFQSYFELKDVPVTYLSDRLRLVSQVSDPHPAFVQEIIETMMRGDPTRPPYLFNRLIDFLADLVAQTQCPVRSQEALTYLQKAAVSPKVKKVIRTLI